MKNANDNIPPQVEGNQTDFIHFTDCATQEEAHRLFLLAKSRLKDISQWHTLSGAGSAKFTITDAQGNAAYKMAEAGDLFSIDIPGSGPMAGDGFEWVRIEAIDEQEDAEAESEYITLIARPLVNPKHPGKAVAHFFDHHSTSTFIVERYKNHVSSAVHGRNEMPNNSDTGIFDTVRNTIIALAARKGLSGLQWKALVIGLIDN